MLLVVCVSFWYLSVGYLGSVGEWLTAKNVWTFSIYVSVFIYHSTTDSYSFHIPFVYHRLNNSIAQTRKESLNNHAHTYTHTHTYIPFI